MTTVIMIFIVLLSGYSAAELTAVPWDNTVLHYIMPIVVMLDWLVDRPRTRVGYRRALTWLAVPLAYLVYSLVRGPIVHWYPYPFMNASLHGYPTVLVTSAIIAVILAGVSWIVASAPYWPVLKGFGGSVPDRAFSPSAPRRKPSDSSSG
jgi:hypothetical protein